MWQKNFFSYFILSRTQITETKMISTTGCNSTPTFTGFYKVKGTARELRPLVHPIKEAFPDSFVFFKDKTKWRRTLYILTGKHQDKFVENIGKVDFMDLKEQVEKFLGEKASKIKLKKIKKMIDKK